MFPQFRVIPMGKLACNLIYCTSIAIFLCLCSSSFNCWVGCCEAFPKLIRVDEVLCVWLVTLSFGHAPNQLDGCALAMLYRNWSMRSSCRAKRCSICCWCSCYCCSNRCCNCKIWLCMAICLLNSSIGGGRSSPTTLLAFMASHLCQEFNLRNEILIRHQWNNKVSLFNFIACMSFYTCGQA